MASMNEVTLIGYCGSDPEVKFTKAAESITTLNVATSEKRKNSEGEYQDETIWWRCSIWGKAGEAAEQFLHKGSLVYISGTLRKPTIFQDKAGENRIGLEVRVAKCLFLDKKPKEDEG